MGGAEDGSLLITSDGALANHTHYSFKMTVLDTSIVSQVEQHGGVCVTKPRQKRAEALLSMSL